MQDDLVQIFLEECDDIFIEFESDLLKLETNSEDQDLINSCFRAAHSLKGNAATVGFENIKSFMHIVEDLMDKVRNGELLIDSEIIDNILKAVDLVKKYVATDLDNMDADDQKKKEKLVEYFSRHASGHLVREMTAAPPQKAPEQTDISETGQYEVTVTLEPDAFTAEDLPDLLSDLDQICQSMEVTPSIHIPAQVDDFDPKRCYTTWKIRINTDRPLQQIRDIFIWLRDEQRSLDIRALEDASSSPAAGAESVAVDNTAGELDFKNIEEKKLGDLLVEKKVIKPTQLQKMLNIQRQKNTQLGQLLVEEQLLTEKQLEELLKEQQQHNTRVKQSYVRVATQKLDSLVDLIGELVIEQSKIRQIFDNFDSVDEIKRANSLHSLEMLVDRLQNDVMQTRMVPIGPTFEQFKRVIRDLSNEQQKEVELVLAGQSTEIDKNVIEQISSPLKHLIRNSVDHGVEPEADRLAAGKPKSGHVYLSASHSGDSIIIRIRDDGKGLDRDTILKKAEEKGLVTAKERLSDREVYDYIFHPGFSTADKVTDVSGRGVGMDVVRKNVEQLNGKVTIDTVPGQGTTFEIKLPLTLSIMQGLKIRVGKHIYLLPMLSVSEMLSVTADKVKHIEERQEVVLVREDYVPIYRIQDLLGIDANRGRIEDGILVIVTSGAVPMALFVDEVLGEQQVVLKPLPERLKKNPAVSSGTILGDGSVSLILDVDGLKDATERRAAVALHSRQEDEQPEGGVVTAENKASPSLPAEEGDDSQTQTDGSPAD